MAAARGRDAARLYNWEVQQHAEGVNHTSEYSLVFYLDEQLMLAAANFALDYLLLWATAAVTRTRTVRWRLVAGAAFGTLYYALYVLSMWGLIPYYGYLQLLPTAVLVSAAMLAIVFCPVQPARFWSVAAHFYLVSFLSAGSGLAGAQLLGQPGRPNPLAGIAVAIGSLFLVAELGWGVLERQKWRRGLEIPLDIQFGTQTVRVTALLDTGNKLRDPLSGAPVVVVEHTALAHAFPAPLSAVLQTMETGDLSRAAELLSASGWSTRFRLIPFTSLGSAGGLMIGFRPDRLTLRPAGKAVGAAPCVVALSPRRLDPAGRYQALIGPDLAAATVPVQPDARHVDERHTKLSKEEVAHAVTNG